MATTSDDWEDLGFSRDHYWIYDPPKGWTLQFDDSNESWKLGPVLKERVLHGDEYKGVKISEAAGTFIATQIEGPQKGRKAIAKIRMQIPPGMDYPSERDPDLIIRSINHPFLAPGLPFIGYEVRTQSERHYVPGGYITYTLMEKVPRKNLHDWNTFDLQKRNRVRIAFGKAIREFYSYGLIHNDPQRHNVIWDENTDRCWIIDLEDANYADEPQKFIPRHDWTEWGMAAATYMTEQIDPMLPDYYDECPDDDALYALAARTKTRQFGEQ